jgi:hypothetical protein
VSIVPPKSPQKVCPKIRFKTISSSELAPFEIPRKNKLDTEEPTLGNSVSDINLPSFFLIPSSSSSAVEDAKPVQILKQEDSSEGSEIKTKSHQKDFQTHNSLANNVAAVSDIEEVGKLRLAHLEKAGFQKQSKPKKLDEKPVSPNVPNSGKSSEGSVRDSLSHIKTNLTRNDSDAKPSLRHGKLVSKTDDLGQKQLKAHHSLKRKLDDGVKVFFNGKEIKIPKLGPVEVEKDKIDKKHLSHCKEKSSSSNVCSVEPNNSPDSNDTIPKGASSSKKSMKKKSPKRTLKLKPVQIVRGGKQIMFRKGSLSKLKLNLLKSLAKEKSPFQKKL